MSNPFLQHAQRLKTGFLERAFQKKHVIRVVFCQQNEFIIEH